MKALYLGDARAEQDYGKTKEAFFHSADYRTLIESDAKTIAVGRRDVGKSALYLRLRDYYGDAERVEVVGFAPDEHEVVSFRTVARYFNSEFRLVRAATRLAFRYALLMEAALALSQRYKFKQTQSAAFLSPILVGWQSKPNMLSRVKAVIDAGIQNETDPEARVGAIADYLNLTAIESAVGGLCARNEEGDYLSSGSLG